MTAIVANWVWIYKIIAAMCSPPAWPLWVALAAACWYWLGGDKEE